MWNEDCEAGKKPLPQSHPFSPAIDKQPIILQDNDLLLLTENKSILTRDAGLDTRMRDARHVSYSVTGTVTERLYARTAHGRRPEESAPPNVLQQNELSS